MDYVIPPNKTNDEISLMPGKKYGYINSSTIWS